MYVISCRHESSIQPLVCLTYFSPRSFPSVVAMYEITLGSVNVRFDDMKNKTIHNPVIGTAVPKTTAPTTYAPYIKDRTIHLSVGKWPLL